MGRKLIILVMFCLLAVLIAGYYGLLPVPWLDGHSQTLEVRDAYVNKSARMLDSKPD